MLYAEYYLGGFAHCSPRCILELCSPLAFLPSSGIPSRVFRGSAWSYAVVHSLAVVPCFCSALYGVGCLGAPIMHERAISPSVFFRLSAACLAAAVAFSFFVDCSALVLLALFPLGPFVPFCIVCAPFCLSWACC